MLERRLLSFIKIRCTYYNGYLIFIIISNFIKIRHTNTIIIYFKSAKNVLKLIKDVCMTKIKAKSNFEQKANQSQDKFNNK